MIYTLKKKRFIDILILSRQLIHFKLLDIQSEYPESSKTIYDPLKLLLSLLNINSHVTIDVFFEDNTHATNGVLPMTDVVEIHSLGNTLIGYEAGKPLMLRWKLATDEMMAGICREQKRFDDHISHGWWWLGNLLKHGLSSSFNSTDLCTWLTFWVSCGIGSVNWLLLYY